MVKCKVTLTLRRENKKLKRMKWLNVLTMKKSDEFRIRIQKYLQ